MKRTRRRSGIIVVTVAILVAVVVSLVWVAAVERWIGQELRSLAASYLNPVLDFGHVARTVTAIAGRHLPCGVAAPRILICDFDLLRQAPVR